MGYMKNTNKILVGQPEETRPFGGVDRNNIKMDLK
jgi:hypothetical protein